MREDLLNLDPRALLLRGADSLGVDLGKREKEQFDRYMELLRKWGGKMNLTTRLDPKEIVLYHFLDSLSILPFLREGGGERLVDIGSGAGFPALPLKICLPALEVTLIESSHKKVSFCREVARQLGLAGVQILEGRAENLAGDPRLAGAFDWVLARALGKTGSAAKLCLPFVGKGGAAVLFKGPVEEEEFRRLQEEVEGLGAEISLQSVDVPYLDATRTLLFLRRRST